MLGLANSLSTSGAVSEFLPHIGISDWSSYIKQDPRFMRPAEVDVLRGSFKKAKENLGWTPQTSFTDLVEKMVENDLKLLKGKK